MSREHDLNALYYAIKKIVKEFKTIRVNALRPFLMSPFLSSTLLSPAIRLPPYVWIFLVMSTFVQFNRLYPHMQDIRNLAIMSMALKRDVKKYASIEIKDGIVDEKYKLNDLKSFGTFGRLLQTQIKNNNWKIIPIPMTISKSYAEKTEGHQFIVVFSKTKKRPIGVSIYDPNGNFPAQDSYSHWDGDKFNANPDPINQMLFDFKRALATFRGSVFYDDDMYEGKKVVGIQVKCNDRIGYCMMFGYLWMYILIRVRHLITDRIGLSDIEPTLMRVLRNLPGKMKTMAMRLAMKILLWSAEKYPTVQTCFFQTMDTLIRLRHFDKFLIPYSKRLKELSIFETQPKSIEEQSHKGKIRKGHDGNACAVNNDCFSDICVNGVCMGREFLEYKKSRKFKRRMN